MERAFRSWRLYAYLALSSACEIRTNHAATVGAKTPKSDIPSIIKQNVIKRPSVETTFLQLVNQ
jgi:hypothetical protein